MNSDQTPSRAQTSNNDSRLAALSVHSRLQQRWIWSAGLFGLLVFIAAAIALTSSSGAQPASAAVEQAAVLSNAFSQVAEKVSPAVVSIKVEAKAELPQGFFFGRRPESSVRGGSGFVFRADGAILTNNHVVDGAEEVEVKLQDGRTFSATVVGTDPAADLAVLKIDAKKLPVASFADSDKARVGEWVVAIGSPFGLDYTLTVGVLSAKGRGIGANEIEDYLQTDASINPGNSGGPLINLHGEVLGINTVIVGPRSAGVGFAIPSNLVRRVAEQLLDNGEVSRAWIGVSFQELTPDLAKSFGAKLKGGALVSQVMDGGPAEAAGIKPGDIIERVDNAEVHEGHDLLRAVLNKKVAEKVSLSVLRNGKRMVIELTTGERPGTEDQRAQGRRSKAKEDNNPIADYGMAVQMLTPELKERLGYKGDGKLMVRDVEPGGAAAKAGLQPGDVIVEADRKRVATVSDMAAALSDGRALLRVDRREGSLFLALRRKK